MEFQTIVTMVIALVVLIAVVVFFSTQAGFLTQGFGAISSQTSQGAAETGERVGSIAETSSGVESICNDQKDNDADGLIDCDDPDCIYQTCKSGENVGKCMINGECGGWRDGPCTSNTDCMYTGYNCVDNTCGLQA